MGDTKAPRWEVGVVYVLCDPRNGEIRYCGKTTESPRNRLMEHLRYAKGNIKRYSYNWMRGLLRENLEPVMKVCTKVDLTMLQKEDARALMAKMEVDWIAALRADGHRLTNATNGGEGCHGRILSEETKKKIGASNTGKERSAEWCRNISEGCLKKPASAYVRGEKHPLFGTKWKDRETRVESMKRAWSDPDLLARHSVISKEIWSDPEMRRQQSVRQTGRMCIEERKKQSARHRGFNNCNSHFTEQDVRDIFLSPLSARKLAEQLDINRGTICNIRNRKTYADVTADLQRHHK